MSQTDAQILLVDDERRHRAGVREALEREGYTVELASDGAAALEKLEKGGHPLVIADARLPGLTGVELLAGAEGRKRKAQFILMTAHATVEGAVEAMKAGAFDYLSKPIDLKRLRLLARKALEFQAVITENSELKSRLQRRLEPSPLLGASRSMHAVAHLTEELAQNDVTVLVEGESGTGKEIVARTIHFKSRRRQHPFISVNCAALPEQLIETELFGHVRGAFTGATHTRPGRLQMAHRGTLFLDEIGDLAPKGQADLLRVLEDGTFRMVGGAELIHVNVRFVAATNKNLQEAVANGQFREDLFYRLQIVPIVMPALRERIEDLPLLVDHFIEHFCAKHKQRHKRFSPEALRVMREFEWPGNVRQLRNVIERVVITCKEPVVEARHLPDFFGGSSVPEFTVQPGTSLAEMERRLIRQTLLHVTSNRTEAARILGISRRALQYKLKEYNLLGELRSAETKRLGAPQPRPAASASGPSRAA